MTGARLWPRRSPLFGRCFGTWWSCVWLPARRVQNVDVEERLRGLARMPLGVRAGELAVRVGESRNALLVGNANAGMVLDALFEEFP